MSPLPYVVPDHSTHLNVGILLLILKRMGVTPRGKWMLTNERLLVLLYLVKHPTMMAKLLRRFELPPPTLAVEDSHSVASIAVNVDALFDHEQLRYLLMYAASRNLIAVSYRKPEGFVYALSPTGSELASELTGDYFDKIDRYLTAAEQIRSHSTASLNAMLSEVLKGR
ncbi:conserved hypothetical protein [Cupriavidus taiwanensis]|uniref:ABC-three component system middle component 4 n=1 Tax=Cupriavidus taiwanensis TaxID=164546 RepID=UPI000E12245E|nr:ABC-three component system middle component 4 [Cupriavidus taiwanensis]SOY94513.1 conserved hypothetical protein [Cupriavidus taiwanensis]SOY98562.1 conserved hypothetical protein [Cupriavidus taiwanensis]